MQVEKESWYDLDSDDESQWCAPAQNFISGGSPSSLKKRQRRKGRMQVEKESWYDLDSDDESQWCAPAQNFISGGSPSSLKTRRKGHMQVGKESWYNLYIDNESPRSIEMGSYESVKDVIFVGSPSSLKTRQKELMPVENESWFNHDESQRSIEMEWRKIRKTDNLSSQTYYFIRKYDCKYMRFIFFLKKLSMQGKIQHRFHCCIWTSAFFIYSIVATKTMEL